MGGGALITHIELVVIEAVWLKHQGLNHEFVLLDVLGRRDPPDG